MMHIVARCLTTLVAAGLLLLGAGTGTVKAADPILLGAPLSTAFLYGWDAERGIKLAVDEINAAGGVNVGGSQRPLAVEVIDTRDLEPGVPVDDALKAVEKLILQKNVDFLVGGPVRSEAALAVLDLLHKHKKVSIVTTGVLSPAYHKTIAENYDKYKYAFRISNEIVNIIVKEMMPVFEKFRKDFGLERVHIMVQDVAHARKSGEVVEKFLTKAGFTVVGHDIYPTGNTDFAPGLLKSRRENAQVLFIFMDMPETAILLKQWRDFKLKSLPFGFMSAAEQPGFWEASKGAVEYAVVDLVNGGNAPSTITPWTMKFVDAYKAKWGLEPEGYGTSSSYMAVYALKDAIERAGSTDPDKVVAALETIDLMGVYGRIRFDPKTHQVIPSTDPNEGAITGMIQWQNGKRVTFWPEAGAVGTLVLPPWAK